jgi:HB1, ASXL, restriction endonuclease HTH domain
LTAAAQVLRKARRPMNCRELIETMVAKRLRTSPQGKTPHATLHAAISREIGTKGADARFRKATDAGSSKAPAPPNPVSQVRSQEVIPVEYASRNGRSN